jgi:hypothetical protein
MKKALYAAKRFGTLFAAVAALLASTSACHAGSVYLTEYYYTYTTLLNGGVYPLGGNITWTIDAYALTSSGTFVVGSTGPGPDVSAGSTHIYIGGPIDRSTGAFQTTVPYWRENFGVYILETIPYGPPGQYVTLYTTTYPTFLAPASVPH